MSTTPEAVKGVPLIVGNPAPALRADHNDLGTWARDNVDRSVANIAARNAIAKKWVGQKVLVADGISNPVYVCLNPAGSGTWVLMSEDTGYANLTLSNSWVAYGAPYATPRYRRVNGEVHVEGMAKSGTATSGTTIATLPVGFRPVSQRMFGAVSNLAFGSLEVLNDGKINVTSIPGNSSLSFDLIRFFAEQ